jgi:hypothetical protein
MKKMFLLLICFCFVMPTVWASFLLEPFVGYVPSSKAKLPNLNNVNYEYKYSGVTYGGRLGLYHLGFMAGIQYDMANFNDFKQDTPNCANCQEDEVKATNMGAFVGLNLPGGLRFFGNYFFKSQLEGQKDQTNSSLLGNKDKFVGDGYGVGVGYKFILIPLAINVEYRSLTFNEWELYNSTTGDKTTLKDYKLSTDQVMCSLSMPVTFL